MFESRIKLKNIDERIALVKIASSVDCDVDLRRGSNYIDAKSELGVVSLDMSMGDTKIRIFTDDEEIINKFSKWFVK